jgi:uncharacterized caspase-like protein
MNIKQRLAEYIRQYGDVPLSVTDPTWLGPVAQDALAEIERLEGLSSSRDARLEIQTLRTEIERLERLYQEQQRATVAFQEELKRVRGF